MSTTTSRVARGAIMTVALLVGSLVLPGSADVSDRADRAGQAAKAGQQTASQKYKWAPSLFDFAFEYGESLTDRPGRGTKRKGRWIDVSTGSGRAARHNGGLMVESKYGVVSPRDAGPGDHGTTTLTLQGNPQTYGRWELRANVWTQEAGKDYTVRYSLVPEKAAQRACGARSITVAEFGSGSSTVRFGAFTPSRSRGWTGSKGGVRQGTRGSAFSHAYAVEVGRDHITWFVDAKPVGTLKARAALPKVPLTMQISLIGDGNKEMRHTYLIHDWIRGFPITKGKQVRSGKGLKAGKNPFAC